jgi:hypothetical protein
MARRPRRRRPRISPLGEFAAKYLDGRSTDARIDATTNVLQFPDQSWSFERVG